MQDSQDKAPGGTPTVNIRDIIPMTEFARNMKSCVSRMREQGRPLVITSGGRPSMVVMTPACFEELSEQCQHIDPDQVLVRKKKERSAER